MASLDQNRSKHPYYGKANSSPDSVMGEVISTAQLELNAALHKTDSNFGNRVDGAGKAIRLVDALNRMNELGVCDSVLDYGTGKGSLVRRLRSELPAKIQVEGYDPAMPDFASKPEAPSDILLCLDVLEHIEMRSIDAVLKDIHRLTRRFCYLVIDLQPAGKKLADGRNAHILLAPAEWWISRVAQLFACQASFPMMHEAGEPQKIVIAACHDPKLSPLMYGFLVKLKSFDCIMGGGVLDGMIKLQKKKSEKNMGLA